MGKDKNTKNKDFIMMPINDFCFKELMAVEKVRRGFIGAVLDMDPEEITETILIPTILRKHYEEEKYGILDIRVLLNDGTQIDMEMQVLYFDYWRERTLFYTSKMYCEQIEEGQSYDNLKKCVSISILNFKLFDDSDDFYSYFQLREVKRGTLYSDKMEFHVFELPKLKDLKQMDSAKLQWARFFSGKKREEFKILAKQDEYIGEAYKALDRMSADKRKRLEYEAREKAIRDHNHLMYHAQKRGYELGEKKGMEDGLKKGMKQGLEQGLERGLEQGLEQGLERGLEQGLEQGLERGKKEQLKKNILRMRSKGLDVETIADLLGDSVASIEEFL